MPNRHQKRLRAETRFRWWGRAALALALSMLAILLATLFSNGLSGFQTTQVQLEITYDAGLLGVTSADEIDILPTGGFFPLIQSALKARFPQVTERSDLRELYGLISMAATRSAQVKLQENSGLLGQTVSIWLTASSRADMAMKGNVDRTLDESLRSVSNQQFGWLDQWQQAGQLRRVFNPWFFSRADSRSPEKAGFMGSIVGSLFVMLSCFLLAFPLAVATAVYLEEFAPKNRWTDLIEVNINNLAAVPSIVYGLLGLSLYINVMHLPRSAALVGGFTLALLILPIIIIATRSSLKAVPDSIRQAAFGLGATQLQTVWHHTLPLAMPGVMTGAILGMARAIGETAPLLMIGMVAFVADIPMSPTDPATAMPVQIYLWATSPESGFVEKTASGILVLLLILLSLNVVAACLRKRFEVRW